MVIIGRRKRVGSYFRDGAHRTGFLKEDIELRCLLSWEDYNHLGEIWAMIQTC